MAPVGEQALGVLVEAMQNPKAPWSCRIQAASILCDRAYGRAPQSVSLDVTRRLNDMSLAELLQLEAKVVAEQRLIDLTPAPSSRGKTFRHGQRSHVTRQAAGEAAAGDRAHRYADTAANDNARRRRHRGTDLCLRDRRPLAFQIVDQPSRSIAIRRLIEWTLDRQKTAKQRASDAWVKNKQDRWAERVTDLGWRQRLDNLLLDAARARTEPELVSQEAWELFGIRWSPKRNKK
jgi:hypothetical protein